MDYNKELELLREYLDIYIQLLPTYISRKQSTWRLSFEEYKVRLDTGSCLRTPHYKESFRLRDGKLAVNHLHGVGTKGNVSHRYYNTHQSIKFYTGGNIHGFLTSTINNKPILYDI